jgi:hypothetical protein
MLIIANKPDEVIKMLAPETLAAQGCSVVLPYVGEPIWNGARTKLTHH